MKSPRHNGGAARDYDKKFDFSSPDARETSKRTALHRYLPAELRADGGRVSHTATRAATDDDFSSSDFKARWWPSPDAWQ
jgi:hypothetical protein